MSPRLVAGLIVAGVLLGAPQVLPASAEPPVPSADAAQSVGRITVPTSPSEGEAWIQGSVQDRAGRDLDGVVVQAFTNGDTKRAPVASALTYAPDYGDGHGWFRLYGLKPGVRYKVRFTSGETTADDYKSRWSRTYRLGDGQVEELSTTVLTLAHKVGATLTGRFLDASIKPGQQARLKVTLTSADVAAVSGDIWVKVDRKRPWKAPMRAGNKGVAMVKLPKLALGTHKIGLSFGGSDAVLATTRTVAVTLRVTRSGR